MVLNEVKLTCEYSALIHFVGIKIRSEYTESDRLGCLCPLEKCGLHANHSVLCGCFVIHKHNIWRRFRRWRSIGQRYRCCCCPDRERKKKRTRGISWWHDIRSLRLGPSLRRETGRAEEMFIIPVSVCCHITPTQFKYSLHKYFPSKTPINIL